MIKAIAAVREKKMRLNKAQKIVNVPKTTLRRYVNSSSSPELVLTSSQEENPFSLKLWKKNWLSIYSPWKECILG